MTILERYAETHPRSRALHERALRLLPGGVTHDMRRITPFPIYIDRAGAGRKFDVDGNEYVDYVMGHGSLLLGHNQPDIVGAVRAQAARGTHYGASHELEVAWAEAVCDIVHSAERVRFTSSGTEATMMALRLARAATGREQVIRLREHFHGWNDSVSGQPHAETTLPSSPGLPRGALEASIVIPPNDVEAIERTLDESGANVAALIFEATGAHWGTEPLDLRYVTHLRELTRARGVVLIMDEVITGFRVAPGGAQQAYGITPDLTTLAKILGGGLPGGAVAGRADLLDLIASDGAQRVAHPGTYNANPLSAAAGVTCLRLIADGEHQQRAVKTAATLARALNGILRDESVPGAVYGQSSMLHIAPGMEQQPPDGVGWGWSALPSTPPPVAHAVQLALRRGMLNEGVDLMAGGMMVSSAHTDADVAHTTEAFRRTLRAMKDEGLL